MREDCYEFVYSTKTTPCKSVVYCATTKKAAVRKFKKNVRYVGSFSVYLVCEGFGIWLGLHD